MEKKFNVRLIANTPNGHYFAKPQLLTKAEFEDFESLIKRVIEGELDTLEFDLETENERVYLTKHTIKRTTFVIRKS